MLCNTCHKTCERSLSYVCKCGHLGNKHVGYGVNPSPSTPSRETPSPPSRGQSSPLSVRRAPSKPLLRPFVGINQPKADEPAVVAPMPVVTNSDIASIANNMRVAAEKRKQAEEKASQERKAAAEQRIAEEQRLAREKLERLEQERIKREKEQEKLKAQEQRDTIIAREKAEQERLKFAKLNETNIALEKAPKEKNVLGKIAQDNPVTEQSMDLSQMQQKLTSLVTTQKQIEIDHQVVFARHAERVKMAVTMTCKVCHKDCERGSVFICGCGHAGKQHERFGKAQVRPTQPTEEKEEIAKYVTQLANLKSEITFLSTKRDAEQARLDAEKLVQAKAEKLRQEAEISSAKKAAKKTLLEQEKAEKLALEKAKMDQIAAMKAAAETEREAKAALLRQEAARLQAVREEILLFMQSARSAQWSDGHWYAATIESQVEGSDRFVVLFPEYDERAELSRPQIKSIDFVDAEAQELAEMANRQAAAEEEEQRQAALMKVESDRVEQLRKEEEQRNQKEEEEKRQKEEEENRQKEDEEKNQKEEEEKLQKEKLKLEAQENKAREEERERLQREKQKEEEERLLQQKQDQENEERERLIKLQEEQEKEIQRKVEEDARKLLQEEQDRQLQQERMIQEQIDHEKEHEARQRLEQETIQKDQEERQEEATRQAKMELEREEQLRIATEQQQLCNQEKEGEFNEKQVLEKSLVDTEQSESQVKEDNLHQENCQDSSQKIVHDENQSQGGQAVAQDYDKANLNEPLTGSEYAIDENQQISTEGDVSLSSEQMQSQQVLQSEVELEQEPTQFDTFNSVQAFGSVDGATSQEVDGATSQAEMYQNPTSFGSVEPSQDQQDGESDVHADATLSESSRVNVDVVYEPESNKIVLVKEPPSHSQSEVSKNQPPTLFVNTSGEAQRTSVSAPSTPSIKATDVALDVEDDVDEYDEVEQFCANAKCAQWTDGHWYAAKVERETAERGMFHVVFTEYGDRAILHRSCIQCVDALEAEAEYIKRVTKQTPTTSPASVAATTPAPVTTVTASPAVSSFSVAASAPMTPVMAQTPKSLFQVGAGAPPVPPKPAFLIRPSVDFSAPPIPRLPSSPSLTSILSPPPVPAKPGLLRESISTPKNAPPLPPRDTPRSAPVVPPKDTPKAQDNEREKQRVIAEAKSPTGMDNERSSIERGSFQRIASERASVNVDPEQALKDLIANVQSALWTDGHWYAARVTHQDPTTELFHVLYTEFDGDSADLPRSQVSTLAPQAAEHASKHKSNSSMTSEVLIPLANTQEEKIVSTLVIGQRFVKHDSRDKPQTMKIYCSPDLHTIRWEATSGGTFSRPKKLSLKPLQTPSLRVLDIMEIRKGATTPAFAQSAKNKHPIREDMSFSIIQHDNVSLDLEAETSELRDLWVHYLDWAKRRAEAFTVH